MQYDSIIDENSAIYLTSPIIERRSGAASGQFSCLDISKGNHNTIDDKNNQVRF